MNAWKIIYIMAQWLVFITAYNRPLEAIPVFIEINVGLRPWCLCCRCKLWNRENNLMACPALEFHPFRVRAASGSSPCSLPFRLALFKLGSCWPWWSCHGAQQLRFVELHPKSSCGNRDIKKRLSLKVRVLSFTSLHPMMWSGIYRAPDLTAGTALVGHQDNFCPSQRIILLAEYFL